MLNACQMLYFSLWMLFFSVLSSGLHEAHRSALSVFPPTKCKKKKVLWNSLAIFLRCTFRFRNLEKDVYIQYIFHTRGFLSHRTTLARARNLSGLDSLAWMLPHCCTWIDQVSPGYFSEFLDVLETLMYPNLWCRWCMVKLSLMSSYLTFLCAYPSEQMCF